MKVYSDAYLGITDSFFIENNSTESNAILTGTSMDSTRTSTIANTEFRENSSYAGGIGLLYGYLGFYSCEFIDNTAETGTANIKAAISMVQIEDTTFYCEPELSEDRKGYGYFLYLDLQSEFEIETSTFINGGASFGGAIYITNCKNTNYIY